MKCPQCGEETPDEEWNCRSCRINLYWAVQHYERLAQIRERQGRPATAASPPFLVKAHKDAMAERPQEPADNKVRAAARKVMRRKSAPPDPE